MNLKEKEFREWAFHPVTVHFMTGLEAKVQEAKDSWARAGFMAKTAEETSRHNAFALGAVDMLEQIIDLHRDYKMLGQEEEVPHGAD